MAPVSTSVMRMIAERPGGVIRGRGIPGEGISDVKQVEIVPKWIFRSLTLLYMGLAEVQENNKMDNLLLGSC